MAKAALSAVRVPLTRERIIDAAITFADAHGLSALTMRSLASELGVQPMSLYHHVENKDAIVAGMGDTLLAASEMAATASDWQSWVRAVFSSMRRMATDHPGAIEVFYSAPTTGPTALNASLTGFEVFVAAGLSSVQALHAVHAISLAALGLASDERHSPADDSLDLLELRARHTEQMRSSHPILATVTQEQIDSVDMWEFSATLLISGLETQIRSSNPSGSNASPSTTASPSTNASSTSAPSPAKKRK